MPRFHPTDLPNLTLWLGPGICNIDNNYIDGDGVAEWVNVALPADTFAQATGGDQPIFKMAQRHRFPAVSFVSSDFLVGGSLNSYFSSDLATVYVALYPRSIAAQQIIFVDSGNIMTLKISATGFLQAINTDAGGADTATYVSPLTANEWHVALFAHATGGGGVGVGMDSPRVVFQTSGAWTSGTGLLRFGLGHSGANPLDGMIGEVLGYEDAHAELQRGKVVSYLSSRWREFGDPHEQGRERASRQLVFFG